MQSIHLTPPITGEEIRALKIGDTVTLSGSILTARDAAHKRLTETIEIGNPLPVELEGRLIYYVGPTPARPGQVIGAAGPTTSGRMDVYAPVLLKQGVRGMIGKGEMGENVAEALRQYGGVYFAAVGGAGALIAQAVKHSQILAYDDLGTEAIRELVVDQFTVIVAQDSHGGNLFREGRLQWAG